MNWLRFRISGGKKQTAIQRSPSRNFNSTTENSTLTDGKGDPPVSISRMGKRAPSPSLLHEPHNCLFLRVPTSSYQPTDPLFPHRGHNTQSIFFFLLSPPSPSTHRNSTKIGQASRGKRERRAAAAANRRDRPPTAATFYFRGSPPPPLSPSTAVRCVGMKFADLYCRIKGEKKIGPFAENFAII